MSLWKRAQAQPWRWWDYLGGGVFAFVSTYFICAWADVDYPWNAVAAGVLMAWTRRYWLDQRRKMRSLQ